MIGNDWDTVLESVWKSPGFHKFMNIVKEEYKTHTCYPEYNNIFNALKLTPYNNVKIVILGQDPYHGEGEAHGLSFSVQEGVLLLNSVLTVRKDMPASHKDLGWNLLTDHIIKLLNERNTPTVFILWGNFARAKKTFITNKNHLVIESTHPSPFSARNGFFGSKPFSKANNFLKAHNIKEVNFTLPNHY